MTSLAGHPMGVAEHARDFVSMGTVRDLSRLDPSRGLLDLVLTWLMVLASAWLTETLWHPALYVATVVFIGSRQIALLVMVHEAVHYMFLPRRRWNDRLAEWAAAWPILVPFHSYRQVHLLHHRHLGTDGDPDWARNRPDQLASTGWLDFARVLLGLYRRQSGVHRFIGPGELAAEQRVGSHRLLHRICFYLSAAAVTTLLGAWPWMIRYWLVPLGTWFLIGLRIKGICEHFALEMNTPLTSSRTLKPGLLTRWCIFPLSSAYHIEHHLYPSVPHYNLAVLHRELQRNEDFAAHASLSEGLDGVFGDCLAARRRRS